MVRKKTRHHSRWKLDADYLAKLSPDERAWLERFHDEYYRAEFGAEPLHAPGEPRLAIFAAQNAAERDIATAPPGAVVNALARAATRPSHVPRFYSPADYRKCPGPVRSEDDLIEWIDRKHSAADEASESPAAPGDFPPLKRAG